MKNNILVITAHPDDLEFGCGGTIAKRAREGCNITLALSTCGGRGSRDQKISLKDLKLKREREQKEAAKILGFKQTISLDFPDGELEPNLALRESLTRVIRKYQPDIVYTHDPTSFYFKHRHHINHPDHRAVGEAALAAIFPAARDTNYFPQHFAQGLVTHKVEKIFLFNTDHWDWWEDISTTVDLKIKALLKHKSQFDEPEEARAKVKKYARAYGRQKNMEFAEVFKFLDLQTSDISIPV